MSDIERRKNITVTVNVTNSNTGSFNIPYIDFVPDEVIIKGYTIQDFGSLPVLGSYIIVLRSDICKDDMFTFITQLNSGGNIVYNNYGFNMCNIPLELATKSFPGTFSYYMYNVLDGSAARNTLLMEIILEFVKYKGK